MVFAHGSYSLLLVDSGSQFKLCNTNRIKTNIPKQEMMAMLQKQREHERNGAMKFS